MKATSLVVLTAVAALGQSSVIDSGSANAPKFGFYWETRLDPGSPELGLGFGRKTVSETANDKLGVYRIFVDRSAKTYFGYSAVIGTTASLPDNQYLISVGALVLTPDLVKRFDLKIDELFSWKQLPFRGLDAQRLRPGDVVGFALMENPVTKQRITESITIQEPSMGKPSFDPEPRRQFSNPPGESRDITASDVEFSLTAPRLYLNGTLEEGASGVRSAAGRTVIVQVPKLGRVMLALVQHPGFAKAGEVRGTSIRVNVGAERIEIQSAERIAPSDQPFNVYVKHEPGAAVTRPSVGTGGSPSRPGF